MGRFNRAFLIAAASALLLTSIPIATHAAPANSEETEAEGDGSFESPSLLPSSTIFNVTEVYSLNNSIENCYYKPKLDDLPMLEERVLQEGFVNAYTGYFDLDRGEEYKPSVTSRALEILGYDFMLAGESFEGGKYKAIQTPSGLTMATAVMDIYKALGLEQFSFQFFYSPVEESKLKQSPAVLNLPSATGSVDGSRGRTDVFVTRSNPQPYIQKAVKDLKYSSGKFSNQEFMTGREFIVLVMQMMEYYGEPVMSQQEMSKVLQAYGGSIPSYLTAIEQQAYLYLAARGMLNNPQMNYAKPISLQDALDIMMCIKDPSSRSDFKEIQLTMEVDSELQKKGYFPKAVNFETNDTALEITVEVDYSTAGYYDYYIEITNETMFVDRSGNPVNNIFVPSEPGTPESEAMSGVEYLGIEQDGMGKQYYHIQIPIIPDDSDYMNKVERNIGSRGMVQLNTPEATDLPYNLWVQQGGGVLSNPVRLGEGYMVTRRPFNDGEFPDAMSIERKMQGAMPTSTWSLGSITRMFKPMVAHAAPTGPTCKVIVANPENLDIGSLQEALRTQPNWDLASKDLWFDQTSTVKPDKAEITAPLSEKGVLLSMLQNSWAKIVPENNPSFTENGVVNQRVNTSFNAIVTMEGDGLLVRYKDLQELGVFVSDGIPQPEDYDSDILILDTIYGQVSLNNRTREIVVGSNVYQLSGTTNTVLFTYNLDNSGNSELYVDFRAAYGWSSNIANLSITGDGQSYTVNCTTVDSSAYKAFNDVIVKAPPAFDAGGNKGYLGVIPKDGVIQTDVPKLMTISRYTQSNWMIYNKSENGIPKSYLVVYYLKKAFDGKDMPDDTDKLKEITGYLNINDEWTCRVVELDRSQNEEAGKFSYIEQYGFVYNIPRWSNMTVDKYLDGDYLLPIAFDSGSKLYDINVNYYDGYDYGFRPKKDGYVDIKGNKRVKKNPTSMNVIAAPTSVFMLFGNVKRSAVDVDRMTSTGLNGTTNTVSFGADNCKVEGNTATITFGKPFYKLEWDFGSDQTIYVADIISRYGSDGEDIGRSYRYVIQGSVQTVDELEEEEVEEMINVEIVGGERTDSNVDTDKLSLEILIERIDNSTSLVILFAFRILPYIGLILLIILLGISFMSDMRVVQNICHKTIDPVKILTLGRMNIEDLDRKRIFFGVTLGCIGFCLVAEGNLLRIVAYCARWFSAFTELLRQL